MLLPADLDDAGRAHTVDSQPSEVEQHGQLQSSGQMSRRAQDMNAERGVSATSYLQPSFNWSAQVTGVLWSRCWDIAGCSGQI